MTDPENRCVVLNARPVGVPGPEFFDVVTRPADPVGDGEFRVRNLYLSIDPAMRGWVNNAPNYSPPVPVGDVMRAFAVGEIVESNHPDYAIGDRVSGTFGWQRFAVSDGTDVMRKLTAADTSPAAALGVLGLNGLTAYFGLLETCAPKAGETLVVSAAARWASPAGRTRLKPVSMISATIMPSTTRTRPTSIPHSSKPAPTASTCISTTPAAP